MILVDYPLWPYKHEKWSHLVSDTSYEELHEFASLLSIPQKAFQGDHYDLPERLLNDALDHGAILVDPRELLRRLKAAGLRKRRVAA